MEESKPKKRLSLTTVILLALLLGGITGALLHTFAGDSHFVDAYVVNGIFYVLGQGFIRLMQMLVVPLVTCSLICGASAIGDSRTLGKVGGKVLLLYLFTTTMAVSLALGLSLLTNPGRGLDMSRVDASSLQTVETVEKTNVWDTLLGIIPKNPIGAMANGDMLPIIVFALLVGIILARLGERAQTVSRFFSEFNDVMMKMTMMVMKLAPVGVFCLVGKTFATVGAAAMAPLIKYILTVFAALALQVLIVYMGLLFLGTRMSPFRFLRKFLPVMTFAFSTATSNATIPLNIETLEREMGVSKKISSFTIPLGATINMDGTAILQGVAVVFIAQAYGIHLRPIDYITVILTAVLASVGTAGIPSVGLVMLTMVLQSVGLPVAGISLIMGIDRIVDMARTTVNITGDAVCTTIVASQEGALDRTVFQRRSPAPEEASALRENAETETYEELQTRYQEEQSKRH